MKNLSYLIFYWLFMLLIYIYYYCRSLGHWYSGAIFFIKCWIAAGFATQVHSREKPLGDRLRICDDDEHPNDSFWKYCNASRAGGQTACSQVLGPLRISEFCEIRNVASSHEWLWLFFSGDVLPGKVAWLIRQVHYFEAVPLVQSTGHSVHIGL